jgi:hypothetical protein
MKVLRQGPLVLVVTTDWRQDKALGSEEDGWVDVKWAVGICSRENKLNVSSLTDFVFGGRKLR